LELFIHGQTEIGSDGTPADYRYCGGRDRPETVTTTKPRLLMVFHAGTRSAGRGFRANYQFITGQYGLVINLSINQYINH